MDIFLNRLCEIFDTNDIRENEPMNKHTTFRVGGPARYYVTPGCVDQIKETIDVCREADMPYYIIGRGSNMLVGDGGFDGVIIELGDRFSQYTVNRCDITAQSGIKLKELALAARDMRLSGLEFAHGIPGSLGGAVAMNAGAYGGEMKDVLIEVKALTPEGDVVTLRGHELGLGYRRSKIAERNYIALEATVRLKYGDRDQITAEMEELMRRRREKQPLEYPSAGSTFKRPEGHFAGKLIEDAGLAGSRVGGAMVSDKHCGFIINYDHATAEDIKQLINRVTDTVNRKFGVVLEPEVKIL